MSAVEVCHLYISPGHNFVGHHGREPDDYSMIEVPTIECVAGRGIRGDRGRLQRRLVVAQIALTAVLLVGAGLLLRSLTHVWAVDPGLDPAGVLTFSPGFKCAFTISMLLINCDTPSSA